MPHILVAGKIHPSGVALLEAAPGVTFTLVDEVSEASYAPHMAKADAVVIRTQPMSAATIALRRTSGSSHATALAMMRWMWRR